jgi:glycosyltransferase involved in cell wall biosynthesis
VKNVAIGRRAAIPDYMRIGLNSLDGATVIELVSSIAPESFGLGYAALNLAAGLERGGTNVLLASVDKGNAGYEACEEARFPRERFICGSPVGPSRFRFSPLLVRQLLKIQSHGREIVHSHGLWTYTSYIAGVLRTQWKCPLVVSPHGSLEPFALKISPRKKALALRFYERHNIMTASCLWSLSEQEKASIQTYGYTGPVAIIPNGVNRAVECSTEEIADFRARHNIAPGSRVLLFLSRIARKKNLPLLLRTFARNVSTRPEWVLLIAGSDEGGHIHEVQALIRALAIEKSVRLVGQVSGKEKACAIASASLFVLPSYSEGLPIAVLEAMEYGKPVLVTDGWTFPVTTSARLGWRVSTNEREFSAALLEAMNTSDKGLAELGRTARSFVRENFNWDAIAEQACSLYASLLDKRCHAYI